MTAAAVASQQPPSPSPSHLKNVLADATDDLLHAEFPGVLGTVFSPVRDVVLSPALGVASSVLPALSTRIPLADDVAAFALGTAFGVVRTAYGVIPHASVDDEAIDIGEKQALDTERKLVEQVQMAHKPNPIDAIVSFIVVKPKEITSLFQAAWGFGVTTVLDVVTAPFTGKLSDWIGTLKAFLGYLLYTGIDMEVLPAFKTPRLFANLTIVADEQSKLDEVGGSESRRERSSMGYYPIPTSDFKPLLKDSARYFRYATAAYGVSCVAAAKSLTTFGEKTNLFGIVMKPFNDFLSFVSNSNTTARKRKIAEYVNVDEEDIVYMTPPGAETEDLGHFIAVDHKCKAVVLAIRGTYSLSEIFTDGEAWGAPFCGGTAHSGIAKNSSNLWEDPKTKEATETQKAVAKALLYTQATTGELYKFVITGHSLGGGSACLLNLKIHYENPIEELIPGVKGVKVQCYGIASPPVYISSPDQLNDPNRKKVEKAMDQCVCFIHEDDCVPFLSADAVRRLCNMLEIVDKQTEQMNFIEQRLTAGGVKEPNDVIVAAIKDGSEDLPIQTMALRFAIPSSFVLWFRQTGIDDTKRPVFNAMFCSPGKICERSILLSTNMINHHMPPFYERAVYSVLENVIKNGEEEYMLDGGTRTSPRSIVTQDPFF